MEDDFTILASLGLEEVEKGEFKTEPTTEKEEPQADDEETQKGVRGFCDRPSEALRRMTQLSLEAKGACVFWSVPSSAMGCRVGCHAMWGSQNQ